jgi:hypothetical protein
MTPSFPVAGWIDAAAGFGAADWFDILEIPFSLAIFRGHGSCSMEERRRAMQTKYPILQA